MGKCLLWKRNTKCQAEEILKPYAENHEIMNNTNAEQDSVVHVKETSNFAHPTKWQSCFDLRTIFLSLYLTVLLFAAYIHSGSCAIYFKYNIEKTFTRQFEKTADVASYWNWVSGSLLPHMKATSSSSVAASGGTLHNTVLANVLVVGVVQMRQLRYKKAPSEMNYVKMLQNGQYTAPEEDKNSYFEAWVMSNITGRSEGDQYWIYQDLGEMDLSRTLGQFGGGGYLVEVENDAGKAANTVAYLKENLWIDPRTAELVTELTLFNANTRLLCHLILHLVLSPSGAVNPHVKMRIFPIHDNGDVWSVLTTAAYISMFLLNLCLSAYDIRKIIKTKFGYFKRCINLVELLCFVLRITTCLVYYQVTVTQMETLYAYVQDGHVAFGKLAKLNEYLRIFTGGLVFLESLKAIQVVGHLQDVKWSPCVTLYHGRHLLTQSVVMLVLLCAYSCLLCSLYAAHSFAHAFQSLSSTLIYFPSLDRALGAGEMGATLGYLSFRLIVLIMLWGIVHFT